MLELTPNDILTRNWEDLNPDDEDYGIYVIVEGETTLYVGKSNNVFTRLQEHFNWAPYGNRGNSQIQLIVREYPEVKDRWKVRLYSLQDCEASVLRIYGYAAQQYYKPSLHKSMVGKAEIAMIKTLQPCLNGPHNDSPSRLPARYERLFSGVHDTYEDEKFTVTDDSYAHNSQISMLATQIPHPVPRSDDDYQDFLRIIDGVVERVGDRSKRAYRGNAGIFYTWMLQRKMSPLSLTRDDMRAYHDYLGELYESATSQNIWSVAHIILDEYVSSGHLARNPMGNLDGFEIKHELSHSTLSKDECEELLAGVDRETLIGKRDYAMLQVLLRTGLRRFECAELTLGSIQKDQGHTVFVVYGKGDRRDNVKVPVDVMRHIQMYLEACEVILDISRPADRDPQIDALPLFFGFKRNGKPSYKSIGDHQVYNVVIKYAQKMGSDVTPHGLRATLITYLLGENVPLHKVQYYARHSRPGTTERYDRHKKNLDDSPADKFFLQ